ncbi:hypothetical protein FOCC_FOCC009607 [Frankliniella occidentalis]|nr:hypothetical protein FOCC_FOCC009607 [Frankliniella occidentalis]
MYFYELQSSLSFSSCIDYKEVGCSLGSAHMRSLISTLLLEEPQRYLLNDQHILGDGTYILTNKVLTPFRNHGNLTDEQTNYIRHASARSVVEKTFGILKNKWRRFYYLTSWNLQYGVSTIVACICLHNFLLNGGEDYVQLGNQQVVEQPELLGDDGIALDFHHPDVPAVERYHPLLANARQLGVDYRWDMVCCLRQQ